MGGGGSKANEEVKVISKPSTQSVQPIGKENVPVKGPS
jgi:hypothetical protein